MTDTELCIATCGVCGQADREEVDGRAWVRFANREVLVQDAFPDLSLQAREVVMGHRNGFGYMCATCWDALPEESG